MNYPVIPNRLDYFLSQVRTIKPLTPEREHELAVRYQETGDKDAAHELVVSHLPFVVKVAFQYRHYTIPVQDLIQEGTALRQHIAYVPDEPKYTKGARLQTLKDAYASFFPTWKEACWKKLMKDFDLDPSQKAKTLSRGQRTRFALTLAMSRDAELLVLDEPTTGLDPVFRRELLQRLSATLDERRSILFSTHITSDLEDRADLVTLIRDGEVFFSQPQDEIRKTWSVVKGETDLLDAETRAQFVGLRTNIRGFEGLTNDPESARNCFGNQVSVEEATLEDILVLMGRSKANA